MVKKIVDRYTKKKTIYVPNGINTTIFYDRDLVRKKHSISLLYSSSKLKGWNTAWKVIKKLKVEYPDLEVNLFGTERRIKEWPQWINYTRRATPEQVANIMNRSTIFMCSSISEGFGLTGLEGLLCGCILVTTDCGGIREYASMENSLISGVNDVEGLYSNIVKVFSDDSLKKKLIHQSKKLASLYDRDNSNHFFEQIINDLVNNSCLSNSTY